MPATRTVKRESPRRHPLRIPNEPFAVYQLKKARLARHDHRSRLEQQTEELETTQAAVSEAGHRLFADLPTDQLGQSLQSKQVALARLLPSVRRTSLS